MKFRVFQKTGELKLVWKFVSEGGGMFKLRGLIVIFLLLFQNLVFSGERKITILRIGILSSKAENVNGIQIGLLSAKIENKINGLQFSSVIGNIEDGNGVQISGIFSIGETLKGITFGGMLNGVDRVKGIQLSGLLSHCDNIIGLQPVSYTHLTLPTKA